MITSLPPVDAENPCPEQGDIIQIKLSEHTEVLPKADGTGSTTMLVDTVFEMNYSTGQWTRLKKYKPITNTSWDASLAQKHTPENFLSTSKKKHVYTHTHTQVFAYTFGPNKALGGWEVVKERKVLPFPAPPKCRTLWRIFLYFLFGCFPDPFIVSVFKSLPIPEWCRVQEGWELYASLRRRIILTAGNFQHLYSEVQACHMSCHSKEKTSCLYFSVWMWPSQLITDLSELNMICERGKKKKRRKERTVMTVIIEVTKKWIVLNAVKFCLEPSGRCLKIFHPFSKEGKKIKWQQTPQRLFFPFLSHL